jgi:hypothetical protein
VSHAERHRRRQRQPVFGETIAPLACPTAVLERTAVIQPLGDRWADKRTVRLADVLVDPGAISWRPKPPSPRLQRRLRRRTGAEPQEQREASGDRAHASQEQQRAVEAAVARASRPAAVVSRVHPPSARPAAQRPSPAGGATRPQRPAPDVRRRAGLPGTRLSATVLELAEQLRQRSRESPSWRRSASALARRSGG